MTKAEIAQLKAELTADYKRKVEAIELVEQMLNQRQQSQPPIGRNKVQPAKLRPSAKVSGTTIAARVEQAFQKEPKWTTPAVASALGTKNRNFIWAIVNRLVKEGTVRISKKPSGRQPAEYTRVTR